MERKIYIRQTALRALVPVFFAFFNTSCKTESASSLPDGSQNKKVMTIFAASGSRPVVTEICDLFQKTKNVVVERNFASSGTLARQIASGAAVDLFVSANKQWIDFLQKKNF